MLREETIKLNIPLIFDEVYTGFRMAQGGAQEFYGIQADIVVYGKTLGGGMPVGVVCGKKELMHRFDKTHPLRVNYVIGTFSAAPITLVCVCVCARARVRVRACQCACARVCVRVGVVRGGQSWVSVTAVGRLRPGA